MEGIIHQKIKEYRVTDLNDQMNALKEVIQEVVLSGLARGGFFKIAAFHGGTSLRIFHNIDRFSEDLDFCLIKDVDNFSFSKYLSYVEKEAQSVGFNIEAYEKDKTNQNDIKVGYIKGNEKEHLLKFFPDSANLKFINKEMIFRIKLDLDMHPCKGANYEILDGLFPYPYKVRIMDLSTLFAGKIGAILGRNYKHRVKGRDYYDFIFYINKGVKVNPVYLKEKLIQDQLIDENDELTLDYVKSLLNDKFDHLDIKSAKEDLAHFVPDYLTKLSNWSNDYFKSLLDQLFFL